MQSLRNEIAILLSGKSGKYYIVAFVVPVVVVLLFSALFVNNQITEANVVVIDLDNSAYSNQLIDKLNASQYINVKDVLNQPANPEELLYHEEYLGIIYLAQGLEQNHAKAMPNNIGLFLDNTNTSSTTTLRTAVQEVITAENLSVSIPRIKALGVNDDQASGILSNINVQQRLLFNPSGSYANTMVIGFLVLHSAIFFAFATLPILPRLRVMQQFESEIMNSSPLGVLSRVIPYSILFTIGIYFGVGLIKVIGGGRFAGDPITFLIPTFIYGIAMGLLAMFVTWNVNHPGAAAGKMTFVVIPGFLLGGITISTAILPSWANYIGNAFPMVWFLRFIRSIGLRGAPLSSMLGELGGLIILLGVIVLANVLMFYKQKRKIMNKQTT